MFGLYSCQTSSKKKNEKYDSALVIVPKIIPNGIKCDSISKGYYYRFGAKISNYYVLNSLIPYDINKDGVLDTIAIINPMESEIWYQNFCNTDTSLNEAILVESITISGKSTLKNYFECGLKRDYLNNFHGLQRLTGESFIIEYSGGNKNTWKFQSYLSSKNSSITIDSIVHSCAFDGGGESSKMVQDFSKKDTKLSDINLKSFLNPSQCDEFWDSKFK